jgi:hypothetical protein
MSTSTQTIEQLASREYKYGFFTDIEQDSAPRGLNEDVIRLISAKKQEPAWLLDWRLKAYRTWLTMKEPTWGNVKYGPINYQDIIYYAAPKSGPRSKASTRSIPRFGEPSRSSAFPSRNKSCYQGLLSMPCSTAYRWRPRSRKAGRARHHLLLVLRGGAEPS